MRPTHLELKAPEGKFRVIGVDTFDGDDPGHIIGDYDTKITAVTIALAKGGAMYKTHVYDDQGKHIADGGTF